MKCIACLTLLFAWNLALAQPSDCEGRLREARSAFRQAAFSEVVATLEPCIEAGVLSEIQELEARRLLYYSYTKMGMDKQAGTILNKSGVRLQSSGALDCRDSLDKARPLLEAYPERVLALLDECVSNSSLTSSVRIQVLELYTEAALKLGLLDTAVWAFKKIYPVAPQYKPGNNRSLSYRFFSRKFVSDPRFSFAFVGGGHFTLPYYTRQFSPEEVSTKNEAYRRLNDPHIELQFLYRPRLSHFEWLFGLGYRWNSYNYVGEYENARPPVGLPQNATFAYSERWRESYASIGLSYYPNIDNQGETFWQRLSPYVVAAVSVQRLDKAFFLRPAITFENGDSKGLPELIIASRNNYFQSLFGPNGPALRQEINYSLMCGLGAKYYLGRAFLSMEFRYAWTPSNIVNVQNRRASPELQTDFNFLDNDLRLHQIFFSLGGGYSIFYTVKR